MMTPRALIICLAITWPLLSQTQVRISVKSADTLDFILFLNDVQINNIPCISIAFDHAESGKINLKANFPAHPEIICAQTVTLKKSSASFYEIEKSRGNYKFILKSESILAENAIVAEEPTSGVNENNDEILSPSADTTATFPQETSGCSPVVGAEEYDRMLNEVKDNFFETRKLDVMRNFVTHHCVRVEQMRYMISRLSLEENKILLIKAGLSHIYDPSNLKKLEDDFFLEKNKARVHELVKDNK